MVGMESFPKKIWAAVLFCRTEQKWHNVEVLETDKNSLAASERTIYLIQETKNLPTLYNDKLSFSKMIVKNLLVSFADFLLIGQRQT